MTNDSERVAVCIYEGLHDSVSQTGEHGARNHGRLVVQASRYEQPDAYHGERYDVETASEILYERIQHEARGHYGKEE